MDVDIEKITGLEKIWVHARRTNAYYYSIKGFSLLVSVLLALVALKCKVKATALTSDNQLEYNFGLWFTFIYYSFQALDEMVELYATIFSRQKGALGLIFELNYFIGLGLSIWFPVFWLSGRAELPAESKGLQTFVQVQTILVWVMIAMSVLMSGCFYSMQRKIKAKLV